MQILSRIRTSTCSDDDIEVLKSRHVSNVKHDSDSDSLHVFFRNQDVNQHNSARLASVSTNLFVSKSITASPVGCSTTITACGRIDSTAFNDVLALKKDSRVMLIYNVDISDHLINGQLGTVSEILLNDSQEIDCVLVRFDNEQVGSSLQKRYPNYSRNGAVPIFRVLVTYSVGARAKHAACSKLLQFPLRLAWAITGHKVQGQTFPAGTKVIVNWDKPLQPGLAYMMLSRSKRMEDIAIKGVFDEKQIRCSLSAKLMCEKLLARYEVLGSLSNPFYNRQNLTLACVNIQSLNAKKHDIEKDAILYQCTILLLTETWLNNAFPDPQLCNFVNNYHVKEGRGRGVSAFTKEALATFEVFRSSLKVKLNAHGFAILLIYRHQSYHQSQFITDLNSNLTSDVAIVIGDFNLPVASQLMSMMQHKGFQQIVPLNTHRAANKLDLCFVRNFAVSFSLHPIYYSDHDCLCLTFENFKPFFV